MTNQIFVAEFRYGKPAITLVTIKKETPKQYQVESTKDLIGWVHFGRRIDKEHTACFDSMAEALRYLRGEARKHMRKLQVETSLARSQIASIEQMIEEQGND